MRKLRKLKENEKYGVFESIWDDGYVTISSNCIVNMKTKEIVEMTESDAPEDVIEELNWLDEERVIIDDNIYYAYHKDNYNGEGFYYF